MTGPVAPTPPAARPPTARTGTLVPAQWEPPPWEQLPPVQVDVLPAAAAPATRSTGPSTGLAIGLALTAISLSGLMTLAGHYAQPDLHRTVARAIEIGVALAVALYLVVGAVAYGVVRSARLRLAWLRGPAVAAVAVGVASGGAVGAVLMLHTQAVTGHVVVDSGLSLQLSEDTWWAVVLTMLLLVVAAPLVEETIFRGVLAESFLGSGLRAAIAVSAPAFWLWHWRLSVAAFVLLAGAGAIFTVVYRYRGLLGSMAAHATYNGMLIAVVVMQLSGPGHLYRIDGGTLRAPASWHAVTGVRGDALALVGPSAASVQVATRTLDHQPSTAELTGSLHLAAAAMNLAGDVSAGPVVPVSLPAGDGVQITLTAGAHHATVLEFANGTQLYAIETDDEGSSTAARQLRGIIASFRTS